MQRGYGSVMHVAVVASSLLFFPFLTASALPPEPTPEAVKRIEAALPANAPATPIKPRRLLIYDVNVGYGGHGSIGTANRAFTLMGQRTGAFETTISRDPAVFREESLRRFDAVFLNIPTSRARASITANSA